MLISDWSSDVCSSDLEDASGQPAGGWMPEQRVRLEAALDAFTRTAAYAAFAEKRFGSLAPGQRADFLLIDRDISTPSPAEIRGPQVLGTWIGGRRDYGKGQSKRGGPARPRARRVTARIGRATGRQRGWRYVED